jgi:menaquinone-dependent protoporphyrinogen IX oxidase
MHGRAKHILKNSDTTKKVIKYIVLHGVKKVSDRREKEFTDWNKALEFIRDKESEGVHVDVIKKTIVTNTKIEKIS